MNTAELLEDRVITVNPKETNNPMTTRRKNGLIGLLSHCPSPMKYQNAALLDDDEYHQQEELMMDDVNNVNNNKDNDDDDDDDVWNNDYLQNYHIEYDDNEEFDVVIQPLKSSSVSTTPRKNTRRMMPLERIRPTLGQNLAKLDLCGCQCPNFPLSVVIVPQDSQVAAQLYCYHAFPPQVELVELDEQLLQKQRK